MRKCRFCKGGLPPVKKCEDIIERKGFCNVECLGGYGHKKASEQRERAKKETRRKAKEKLKSLSDWVSDAQTWVNRVVVLEDREKGCISCDTGQVTDAGHYFHRGSKYRTSPLTLDRRNLQGQCRACNSYKGGGNQHEYRLGYIKRYGETQFTALCEYKLSVDRGEVPSLTVDECKEFISQAKQEVKRLKSL